MTAVGGTFAFEAGEEVAPPRRRLRIETFHPTYRRFIAELTSCAPELEDLADSFPALLFALVSGFATPVRRARACELVCDGAPLREAADTLGLAWWLRKLPAQAFTEPLPAFPTDREFAFRIASLIPREARRLPIWLARVGYAYECGGEAYALWIARQSDLSSPPEDVFMFMAAWAWFGLHPGHLGHRLLRRLWTSEMSFKRAREEMIVWRQRLRLVDCLGPGIESPWLNDGVASGYSFVALRTVDDFISESVSLENCLDQYADHLHSGLTALYSIRKGARRIACVEIGRHGQEATMPNILQLRGPRNRRAQPEVWQAAFGLDGQPAPRTARCTAARADADQAAGGAASSVAALSRAPHGIAPRAGLSPGRVPDGALAERGCATGSSAPAARCAAGGYRAGVRDRQAGRATFGADT